MHYSINIHNIKKNVLSVKTTFESENYNFISKYISLPISTNKYLKKTVKDSQVKPEDWVKEV